MFGLFSFVLISLMTSPELHAEPRVTHVNEANLRTLVASAGEYSDFWYLVEFLNKIRQCGFRGDVVQVREDSPDFESFSLNGLYFHVTDVDLRLPCVTVNQINIESITMRRSLRDIAQSGKPLLLNLESHQPFHSILIDGGTNPSARIILQGLKVDTADPVIVIIGRNSLFGERASGQQLIDDFVNLASLHLPAHPTLAVYELLARARSAEISWIGPDILAVRAAPPGRRGKHRKNQDITSVKASLNSIRLRTDIHDEIIALLEDHLTTNDRRDLKGYLSTKTCSDILDGSPYLH